MNRLFFQFAAAHSFLIGLLPFYIPVLLWQLNIPLWQLSFFIALSGLGFLLTLPTWQFLQGNNYWQKIFFISFILEVMLLAFTLAFSASNINVLIFPTALINGAYLCFYWTSQRSLFVMLNAEKSTNNSGKKFGNFQIVALLLLKTGILLGAYLLDQENEILLLIITISIAFIALFSFKMERFESENFSTDRLSVNKTSPNQLNNHTKAIFLLDGVFLYLESYFWLLSLYLVAQQDVMTLGFIVVGLSLLLAALFFVIKNRIDAAPAQKIFQLALMGYALSWLLRSYLEFESELIYPLILVIAFLTSFFRLSFNKRFFDYAHQQDAMSYLLLKSYLSQFAIFVFFMILGLYGLFAHLAISELSIIYAIAAPIALLYGFYSESADHSKKHHYKKVTHA
ncbi:MAG: hypothetical protein HRU08_09460 [Oleispira sp.]|nr:hypothetical protein [Oleispira sp.]